MSHSAVRAAVPGAQRWLGWKVISLMGRHGRTLAGLLILILIAAGLDIAVPFLTREVIDNVVRSLRSVNGGSVRTLILAALAIFAATAITRFLRSFYNYRLFCAVSKCEDEVKNAAFANFLSLDTEYHSQVNTGEIVGALDRGGTAMFVVLYEVLGQNLVPPLLIAIGVLTSLVLKNPLIAAIVFLPLPAYVLAVGRLKSRMQKIELEVTRAFETVTSESYDIASNVRVVKKFSQEREEALTQRQLLHTARGKQYRGERMWAVIENIQTLIATAGRVGVIAVGGYLVLNHRCTIGDYVLFIALQDMVYGPISQLSTILPKLHRNLSRAERMFEILDEKRKVVDAPAAQLLCGTEHSIEFRKISFTYPGAHRPALHDVSFKVPAGSMVALIGPSGSGKSTLMNLLQRLYDPQQGSICIDGMDIRQMQQSSLREHIAVIPQEIELFSRTVAQNIGYGLDAVSSRDLEYAARMAQAHDFIQGCDEAYDTPVGERGMRLSGGERQRIGIARAIVHDPKILILDEATSQLDNESERLIQAAFDDLMPGRTSFVIAHRLSTVRKADMVVVFCDGRVEAVGTHEQLWSSSPTYQKLYGLHVAEKRPRHRTEVHPDEVEALPSAVGE
ncbi:MAG TPA: ABC transporter ATP-binding protein [Bryobacteraceae bacterium]|nr:ABC transporter ATP-binding protein [Bryobacteraceae bacterium]